MAYSHQERLNSSEKGQNESRYPQENIQTGIFARENKKKIGVFFLFRIVSEGYF